MSNEKVVFVKRCPACDRWMVWDFLTGNDPHEWWCYCGYREAGHVDESRLNRDMPIHVQFGVNREENRGEPIHSLYKVEIVE